MNKQPIYQPGIAPVLEDTSSTFRKTISNPLTSGVLTTFRRIAEAQSATLGFLADEQRAQIPHVVRLMGLTRAALGDARFERVYGLCKHSAELIAPRAFWAEAVIENNTRVGYEFGFGDKLAALRCALCHEAAMRGRPLPLARPAAVQ